MMNLFADQSQRTLTNQRINQNSNQIPVACAKRGKTRANSQSSAKFSEQNKWLGACFIFLKLKGKKHKI